MITPRRLGVAACVVLLLTAVISPAFAESIGVARDSFSSVSYSGDDGTMSWAGDWRETPLAGSPSSGAVRVVSSSECVDSGCLRIGPGNLTGRGIFRELDLDGAATVSLDLALRAAVAESGSGRFRVAVSDDGWSWTDLIELNLDELDDEWVNQRLNLSPWAGTEVMIGLFGSGRFGGYVYVDDVAVTLSDNVSPRFVSPLSSRGNIEGDTVSLIPETSDPDDSELQFSASGLPVGLSVDPTTGAISGTIAFAAASASPYSTVLTVTDPEGASASESFTWAVADSNRPPLLEPIADRTVDESAPMTVQVGASDPDLPDDELSFSLSLSPAGASISDTGLVTWTPDETDGPGSYDFTVTVADSGSPPAIASQSFVVNVTEVNRPPEMSPIADLALRPGDDVFVVVDWVDRDVPINAVLFSAEGLPPGTSIAPATGRITGTIANNSPDSSGTATITATDDGVPVARSVQTFSWQIGSGNQPPVLDPIPDQGLTSNGTVTFTASANDSDTSDTLSFWITDGIDPVPDGAAIDEDTGVFTWQPTRDQHGATYRINVGVSDSGVPRLSDTQLVTIVIPEYNEPPSIEDIDDREDAEGDLVAVQIDATDVNSADVLVFTATGLPEGLIIDAATGEISGEIGYEAAAGSPYQVRVTARDNGIPARSSAATFTWTVTDTNRPPSAPLLTVVALIGEQTEIEVPAEDPDGDELTYEVVDEPIMGELEGELPVVIYTASAGTSDGFSYIVSDGEFEVEGVVAIELRMANRPPAAALDEYDTAVDTDLVVAAPGVLDNDSDPDNEQLTAELEAAPDNGTVDLAADGGFTYTPNAGFVGADKFTYAAVDGLGERSSATVVVNVGAAEPGPGPGSEDPEATATIAPVDRFWTPSPDEERAAFTSAGRGLVGSLRSMIGMAADVRYPLILLAAVVLVALLFGGISVGTAAGRKQEEGLLESFDPNDGVGWVAADGGDSVYVHAKAVDDSLEMAAGQRVEFIAATIRGKKVATKVWPAT